DESRKLLGEVQGRLGEIKDSAKALDERKRQMVKAEERLARAEALLVEVRSGIEALEGQKAIIDQAVEETGSLRFLLKQADARISELREERELTTRVKPTANKGRRKGENLSLASDDDEATAYAAHAEEDTEAYGADVDDEEAQAQAA